MKALPMTRKELEGFLTFVASTGTELLKGWLRARADGNEEQFEDWLIGEYEHVLEYPREEYEIPYHGICDSECRAEDIIWPVREYRNANETTPANSGDIKANTIHYTCGEVSADLVPQS